MQMLTVVPDALITGDEKALSQPIELTAARTCYQVQSRVAGATAEVQMTWCSGLLLEVSEPAPMTQRPYMTVTGSPMRAEIIRLVRCTPLTRDGRPRFAVLRLHTAQKLSNPAGPRLQ